MTLVSGVEVPIEAVGELCRRYAVKELALFGSSVRGGMSQESDIDVMVEFAPGARIGMLRFVSLSDELEALFERRVDLVTKSGLKPWIRPNVLREALVVYAA